MKNLVCIVCPRGCRLAVDEEQDYAVTGNGCPRGAEYGRIELTNPTRVVTSTVRCVGGVPSPLSRQDRPAHPQGAGALCRGGPGRRDADRTGGAGPGGAAQCMRHRGQFRHHPGHLTDHQLDRRHRHGQVYSGAGPGHHQLPGHSLRPGAEHRGHRPEGIHPDLPPGGLGGARRHGDLVLPVRGDDGGHRPDRGLPGGRGRHRHHQPAGDHHPLGQGHRPAHPQRHRLAVPPHRPHGGPAAGRRAWGTTSGRHRPDPRRLLLRHQDQVDPGPGGGGPGEGPAGGDPLRHGGQLAAVEAHRRGGPRHRRHQRLPHHALRHPPPGLGRHPAPGPGHPPGHAARGALLQRDLRLCRDPGRPGAHRRHGRGPAGRPLRPDLLLPPGTPRTPTAPAASC